MCIIKKKKGTREPDPLIKPLNIFKKERKEEKRQKKSLFRFFFDSFGNVKKKKKKKICLRVLDNV